MAESAVLNWAEPGFTLSEIARGLDLPYVLVVRWVREGRLPATDCRLLGNKRPRYRVARADLEAFLNKLVASWPAKKTGKKTNEGSAD